MDRKIEGVGFKRALEGTQGRGRPPVEQNRRGPQERGQPGTEKPSRIGSSAQ